jgi:putative nucleotidyltransferase with HDIG domain
MAIGLLGFEEISSDLGMAPTPLMEKVELSEWVVEHSERVAKWAVSLAKAWGVKVKSELDAIELGGLLHDLGKAEVSKTILDKSGELSPAEWVEMKKHPATSLKLAIKSRPNLHYLTREAILFHQESWDGSGYPKGLKGEAIPWPARLIAVVDQWDALVNERPYRRALSVDEATKVMMEVSGKRLDPEMVEVFLGKVVPAEQAH